MTALIELQAACRNYRTRDIETRVLRGIDLEVAVGDYVALHGPSGCGKSTLLNIIGLLDPLTSGSYRLAGTDTAGLSFDELAALRNETIGFVFQGFNLLDDMTVLENVNLPHLYSRRPGELRGSEMLERVGLGHRARHRPAQLSGGQQQRVAIARALTMQPPLLLLDEPTGNLDAENSDAVMELLDTLNRQGTTIVLVTHEPDYARRARRRIGLRDGQIEAAAA
jgi:putative ABC transport system ATP-binding protein